MTDKVVEFRFYEELNDFLPEEKRKVSFVHHFKNHPTVKDAIESLGVPHTEIDLIIVNRTSVDFSYLLQDGDRVAVYPVFESLDISPVTHLRPAPLRNPKFILDVHLGKLSRYMRLLGFDIAYESTRDDAEIIDCAVRERRIILTRDKGILKNKKVMHGYWMRETLPKKQLCEVMKRFDLLNRIQPFTRCLECNGDLVDIDKSDIKERLDPMTERYYETFKRCLQCENIYWKGSHYQRMQQFVESLINQLKNNDD